MEGRRGVYTVFWWGNLRERNHLGDPDVDGRIILRWILKNDGGINWFHLAQDRYRWQDLVNAAMKLRIP
jgi:hypothetical protein